MMHTQRMLSKIKLPYLTGLEFMPLPNKGKKKNFELKERKQNEKEQWRKSPSTYTGCWLSSTVYLDCMRQWYRHGNKCTANIEEQEEMTILVFRFYIHADYAVWLCSRQTMTAIWICPAVSLSTAVKYADYMGVVSDREHVAFNNLLTALNKGQFDIVLANVRLWPLKRKEAADFSDPYLTELAPPVPC